MGFKMIIQHGEKTTKIFSSGRNPKIKIIRGYYLVRCSDRSRFFISEGVSVAALENVANKTLSDKHGFDYWVDYCIGYDINGVLAWSNLDHSDNFI